MRVQQKPDGIPPAHRLTSDTMAAPQLYSRVDQPILHTLYYGCIERRNGSEALCRYHSTILELFGCAWIYCSRLRCGGSSGAGPGLARTGLGTRVGWGPCFLSRCFVPVELHDSNAICPLPPLLPEPSLALRMVAALSVTPYQKCYQLTPC